MRGQKDGGCWNLQKRNLKESSIRVCFGNDNIVVHVITICHVRRLRYTECVMNRSIWFRCRSSRSVNLHRRAVYLISPFIFHAQLVTSVRHSSLRTFLPPPPSLPAPRHGRTALPVSPRAIPYATLWTAFPAPIGGTRRLLPHSPRQHHPQTECRHPIPRRQLSFHPRSKTSIS